MSALKHMNASGRKATRVLFRVLLSVALAATLSPWQALAEENDSTTEGDAPAEVQADAADPVNDVPEETSVPLPDESFEGTVVAEPSVVDPAIDDSLPVEEGIPADVDPYVETVPEDVDQASDADVDGLEGEAVEGAEGEEDGEEEAEEDDDDEDDEEEDELLSVEEAEAITGISAEGEGVDYVAGELLVTFADGTSQVVASEALEDSKAVATEEITYDELVSADFSGGALTSPIGLDPVTEVEVESDATVVQAMAEMLEDPNVVDVQPNFIFYEMEDDQAQDDVDGVTFEEASNDAAFSSQWGLQRIHATEAWKIARCDNSVSIAIIDSGCNTSHEDLAANIIDCVDVTESGNGMLDTTGHGTHVAGIASAVTNNGVGISGASYNANLVIVKAGEGGSFTLGSVKKAYTYVITNQARFNIRVVNLSFGMNLQSFYESGKYPGLFSSTGEYDWQRDGFGLVDYVDRANEAGMLSVSAACNVSSGGGYYPAYPSDYDGILSVMNLNKGDALASGSNSNVAGVWQTTANATKDLCAPGTSIYSTTSNGGYGGMTGTSMASPFVSGVAALCFAADPGLGPYDVMAVLEATADDLGDDGWDSVYGYGCLNSYAAICSVKGIVIEENPAELEISGSTEVEYTGKPVDPNPVVTSEGNTLKKGRDYELSHTDLDSVGSTVVTVTGIGNYTGSMLSEVFHAFAYVSKAKVTLPASTYVYDGKAKEPQPTVTLFGTTLKCDTDYTVSYSANKNAGMATVIIKGKGNYRGSVKKTFTIIPATPTLQTVAKTGSGVKVTWSKAGGAKSYDVYRRIANGSWVKLKNVTGTSCIDVGSPGRLCSYRVYAVATSGTKTYRSSVSNAKGITLPRPSVLYRTHVQNIGWQGYKKNGITAGTSGRSLRLEGIKIKLKDTPYSGGITYCTHIQNIGWQSWKSNDALSGTTGRALRLEAIQIKLTGEMAKRYDVYYRVHCQNIGWMGWAKNGAKAGTAGYAYRLEAIEIVLVEKGGKAPGSTANAFRQKKK